jgi:hypothetical protein
MFPAFHILSLFLLCAITASAVVAFLLKRPGLRHRSSLRWLTIIGGMAALIAEVLILLLLGETGDHFDGRCMQAETVCLSN